MKLAIALIACCMAGPVAASTPDCQPLPEKLAYHAAQYQERVVWMGRSEEYKNTVILLSSDDGSWSEITLDDGMACLIDYGYVLDGEPA